MNHSPQDDSVRFSLPKAEGGQPNVRPLTYSFVVLTFNRNHLLESLVDELKRFADAGAEIIVVDNCSERPALEVTGERSWVMTLRSQRNLGAAGRNLGFESAAGEIVVCLDDDIAEVGDSILPQLDLAFADPKTAAVNFKVLEAASNRVVNWVHHREVEIFADSVFDTYEITEGAVAFRRSALRDTGGYPESFFISHEGPDLAFRLMNRGWRVIYWPSISVVHSFAAEGRTSWRNYYFDTRNTFWLAARNLPVPYGTLAVLRQTVAMLLYAIRDRHLMWWAKGVFDGFRGLGDAWEQRERMSGDTYRRVREIDRFRPSLRYTLSRRLFRRDLKL